MTDNSIDRLHDVFFYGLYMDPAILKAKNVEPRNPRLASVENYVLRIGDKATMLRAVDESCHGLLYSLTHEEINALYWGSGLEEYRAEAVLAWTDNETVAALCCNLLEPPKDDESNPEYTAKLKEAMVKLGVPVTFD